MGDKVQTGPGGEAQIQFKDATKLVVGPNSSMTIDAFVFDESNTARKVTMNATKGAFRFITGSSAKQAYTINTPTATIGVRGTRFDFTVAGNGEMTFAIFEGQARVCDRSGVCRDVRGGCEVVITPPGGGVQPANWGAPVAAKFPYVESQDSLLPAFRVNTADATAVAARVRAQATDSRGRTNPAGARTSSISPAGPARSRRSALRSGGEGEGGRRERTYLVCRSEFDLQQRGPGASAGTLWGIARRQRDRRAASSFSGATAVREPVAAMAPTATSGWTVDGVSRPKPHRLDSDSGKGGVGSTPASFRYCFASTVPASARGPSLRFQSRQVLRSHRPITGRNGNASQPSAGKPRME